MKLIIRWNNEDCKSIFRKLLSISLNNCSNITTWEVFHGPTDTSHYHCSVHRIPPLFNPHNFVQVTQINISCCSYPVHAKECKSYRAIWN